MTFFTSTKPAISIKVQPRFPANVVATNGVKVERSGGQFTFSLDFPPLSENSSIGEPTEHYVVVYNEIEDRYEKVSVDNLAEATSNIRYTFGDADHAINPAADYVALTAALTAPRIVTLPSINSVRPGKRITLQDEVGGISATNTLQVVPSGSDTINGQSSFGLAVPRGGVEFRSNGAAQWVVAIIPVGRLGDDHIPYSKIQNVSTNLRVLGRGTAGAGDIEELTVAGGVEVNGTQLRTSAFTGDVTKTAGGTALTIASSAVTTAKIAADAVDNTKLANMATARLKGRVTAATGDPEDITSDQLRDTFFPAGSVINSVTATASGFTSSSSNIPLDDTVPQNTEGVQVLSAAITLSSILSKVRVRAVVYGSPANETAVIAALFFQSGTSAIKSAVSSANSINPACVSLEFDHLPGVSGAALTYSVRVGAPSGVFNLNAVTARVLGGSLISTLVLEEIKA